MSECPTPGSVDLSTVQEYQCWLEIMGDKILHVVGYLDINKRQIQINSSTVLVYTWKTGPVYMFILVLNQTVRMMGAHVVLPWVIQYHFVKY